MKFLFLLPLLSFTFAQAASRTADDNLSQNFAHFRSTQVRSVNYELFFQFQKKSEEFVGESKIQTELNFTDQPLSIDWSEGKVLSVVVNGQEVKDFLTQVGSISIPPQYLRKENTISVRFSRAFNKDGHGFQRSVDPKDGAEYLASDFEPYYAHTLFPCFDQPDLKASFTVTVDAPAEWKVISNELESSSKVMGDKRTTVFKPTLKISSYLVFLGAGAYKEWIGDADGIPVHIYARASLEPYVDVQNLVESSRKGLQFYNEYFGYRYPFSKFGLVFVPEFSWGGMENPGAIALSEKVLFRGPVSQTAKDGRDNLILHEMAHMWFGDLVTMKWWNDLWLNESFASYMANIAQDRAFKTAGIWEDFYSTKTWGYWQDQLVTTHPIEARVDDTRTAKGNFDGITYAKGAAVLKQLHFLVGEEKFRAGLKSYFKKYAFQNTERSNFIGEIGAAAAIDLREWTKAWIETSGPNRIATDWSCKDGKISSFAITQKASSSHTLSPHRTRIGLFQLKADTGMTVYASTDIAFTKAKTEVKDLIGKACPDFVYGNLDDYDFALYSLDKKSLKTVKDGLAGEMKSSLIRLMVWNTLQQMVRDLEIPVSLYMEIAMGALEKESDEAILGSVLGRHSTFRDYYFSYLTVSERKKLAPRLEELFWKRIAAQAPSSSLQMVFMDFLASIAETKETLTKFRSILNGKDVPPGLTVDQDRRWKLVGAISWNEADEALIESEAKRDNTTTGKRNSYACRVSLPNPSEKEKFWSSLDKPEAIPHSTLRAASWNFHNVNRAELSEPFVKRYFEKVTSMDWKANDELVGIFFSSLFPENLASRDLLSRSKKMLSSAKNLTPLAKRSWLEANEELEKRVNVQEKNKRSSKIQMN